GTQFFPLTPQIDSPTRFRATVFLGFDDRGPHVPGDVYNVVVTRPDGASAVLEGALDVLVIPPPQPGDFDPAEPPDFTANLVLPSGLGYHIPGEIDIEYRNDSFHSIQAPLLVLTPTQTHADGTTTAGAFLTL